jgi:hypothetical protein
MVESDNSITRADKKSERYFRLPTKCVASPTRLLQAVTDQVGEGNFDIEVITSRLVLFLGDADSVVDAT